jgi:hypothetical protein
MLEALDGVARSGEQIRDGLDTLASNLVIAESQFPRLVDQAMMVHPNGSTRGQAPALRTS